MAASLDRPAAAALIDALHAGSGIVAAVGAGGKKSTLYRLLEAHRLLATGRVALMTTVQIAPPPRSLKARLIIVEPDGEPVLDLDPQAGDTAAVIAATSTKPGRLAGLPAALVERLHRDGRFDVSLVKADGARMRLIKAPSDGEPVLPAGTRTVLPIVSAAALGKPLSPAIAHRPERLSRLIDAPIGTVLAPEHIARLLSSDQGALHQVGDAIVVPVITTVDTDRRLELAAEAACAALSMTPRYDRVVLASMPAANPVVRIVSRQSAVG